MLKKLKGKGKGKSESPSSKKSVEKPGESSPAAVPEIGVSLNQRDLF